MHAKQTGMIPITERKRFLNAGEMALNFFANDIPDPLDCDVHLST